MGRDGVPGRRLALLLAAAAAWACGGEEATAPRRPNLVVVSVDTLNRDALRAFAPEAQPLPELDRFAAGALRFTQTFSTASWTLPAQASILTGLHPHHHGLVHPDVALRAAVPTLAESLRATGYQTLAFTDGGFLDAKYGLDRGFDVYDHRRLPFHGLSELPLPRGGRVETLRGEDLFDRAIAYLEWQPRPAAPFFLFLQTYSVHDYFYVKPWLRAPGEPEPPPADHNLRCLWGWEECSEAEWRRLRSWYDAEVRHLDAGFGRLLAALGRHAGAPTYVLLVSDHGEGFDPARGRTHHGGRLHDDVLRVPLLLAGPGLAPGPVGAAASVVDVAPTLLELAGVAAPAGLDGRSLLAPPEPGAEPRTLYASEYTTLWRHGGLFPLAAPSPRPVAVAVIFGDYRLISGRSATAVYSVAGDPLQERDLSGSAHEVTAFLLASARPILEHRPALELSERDAALAEELRALGYL